MHCLVSSRAPRLTGILRNKDISAVAEVSHCKIRNKWAAVKYTDFLKTGLFHHRKRCDLSAFFTPGKCSENPRRASLFIKGQHYLPFVHPYCFYSPL